MQNKNVSVEQLVTTVNTHYNRVSMHGLRKELLLAQTNALGIPANTIELPEMPSMEVYEAIMDVNVSKLKRNGFTHAAFGDIFLEDLRQYRISKLAKHGIEPLFPIWNRNTNVLLNEFLQLGFKSIVICANSKYFNEDFVGTVIDEAFINKLPNGVDPCGEYGEFHTFCFDGPIFKAPIHFKVGEKVFREYNTPKTNETNCTTESYGVWYCDLLP